LYETNKRKETEGDNATKCQGYYGSQQKKEIRVNNKVESLLRLIQNKEEKDKVIYLQSIDLHTHSDRERRLVENLCGEGKRMTVNGYIYIYRLGFYLILPSFIFRV
jgi:hypothetical protein